jgi:23S rRNA (guanine745-N1)-methyltransferase
MRDAGVSVLCEGGHSFDYARQGYLNLTAGRRPRHAGDTEAMVAARARFLGQGHFEPLAQRIAALVAAAPTPRLIVELGSGTGYLIGAVARTACDGDACCAWGFDVSKAATRHAARAEPACSFAVSDVAERLPLRDGCADVVLSAFSPRPSIEIERVARPGALLVVAAAGERHLEGLRRRFGLLSTHPGKLEDLRRRFTPGFTLVEAETAEFPLLLGPDAARDAIMMGPNARHRPAPPRDIEGMTDVASVLLAAFRRTG